MSKVYDAIIVGAGAAGLSCARELLKNNKQILVLEGRARAGGRILSVPDLCAAVELGAEFIHGADPGFLNAFEEAQLPIVDATENRFFARNGKLSEKPDYMEILQKITSRFNSRRKKDRSVAEFLESHSRAIKPEMKSLFSAYIEGFHASELHKISEKALARSEQGDEQSLGGTELFRPVHGYSSLMEKWTEGDTSSWLQLESIVQKVEWKKGEAIVYGRPFAALRARTAVITVPLSVLKNSNPVSQIKFDPQPTGLIAALSGLQVGHVERITFEFTSRFWEDLHKKTIGFLHGPVSEYFPVWWTQTPLRTPFLVAWQGGIRAREIASWPREKQILVALKTLSKMTGKSPATLKKMVKAAHLHNWDSDPFSLGAYSYVGVDGLAKAKRLAKPFDGTLFFAGEHTAEGRAIATVHGAMQSGRRAARQILNVL